MGELGPYITQCRLGLGPRPISVQSFIVIRPTVCPQYTSVTDRTTGELFYKRSPKKLTGSLLSL